MQGTANMSDLNTISKIVTRAAQMYQRYGIKCDNLSLMMDITTVHSNRPLRLEELAEADDFNLMHDVSGIAKYLDRTTGQLTHGFLPRFTAT